VPIDEADETVVVVVVAVAETLVAVDPPPPAPAPLTERLDRAPQPVAMRAAPEPILTMLESRMDQQRLPLTAGSATPFPSRARPAAPSRDGATLVTSASETCKIAS
jgi:hypothetical protein